MKFLTVACSVCFLSSFNEAAAATYEVLPSVSNSLASGTQTYYWAQVLDNTNGKTFACSVKFDRTAKPALSYTCHDESNNTPTAISPSDALNTSIQVSISNYRPSVGALWQINSKTGDLQFCLTTEPSSVRPKVVPCIKLDWKIAPPG